MANDGVMAEPKDQRGQNTGSGNGNGTAVSAREALKSGEKLRSLSRSERRKIGWELASQLRPASTLGDRRQFGREAGLSFRDDSTGLYKRDLYQALGYQGSEELSVQLYRARYERGGIAARIVEAYPAATWVGGADVVEDPDPGVETVFESAVRELGGRLDIWSKIMRADVLAGLGRYGALLIGAPSAQGQTLEDEMPRLSGPEDVLYLRPLAEDNADVIEEVGDFFDERFGLPNIYQVDVGTGLTKKIGQRKNERTRKVHWTRIIHIADGLLEDEVCGRPRLRPCWNYLADLDKLVAGGSEAAWINMNPVTMFDLDPEYELDKDLADKFSDELDDVYHGMRRYALTRGLEATKVSGDVFDFNDNAKAVLELVSATTGIPLRILLGSERGELASSQDRSNWADRISERRVMYGEPVARSLINRLIDFGALPEPDDPYELVWPDIDELNAEERAEVAVKLADANAKQAKSGAGLLLSVDEIRDMVFKLGSADEIDMQGDTGENLETAARYSAARLRSAKARLAKQRGEIYPSMRTARLRVAEDFELTEEPPDEPEWQAVHRAADENLDIVASTIESLWSAAADSIEAEDFEDSVEIGSLEAAELAAVSAIEEAERESQDEIQEVILGAFVAGGKAAARSTRARGSWFRGASNDNFRSAQDFEVSFVETNERSVAWAEARAAALVAEIGEGTRAAIRQLVTKAFNEGLSPKVLAREIREHVGLLERQLDAVTNLRDELRAAKPGSLVERFPPRDGVRGQAGFRVRIPDGGLSEAQLKRRLAKYRDMQRNLRSRTIARTEVLRASNAGQKELWLQAQESGQIPTTAKRVWIVTPDDRLRDDHAVMAGVVVGVDEPFNVPDGTTEPGMAPNCRCAQGLATPQDLERAA